MKEWNVDTLEATDSNNAAIDGDVFTPTAISSASRLNNFHQISRKDFEVSRRADIVNKPGRRSETAYQIMKSMKTLKNDVEAAALLRQLPVAAAADTAPRAAGVPAWIRTHSERGSSGGDPTLVNGRPGTLGAVGGQRGLTESLILRLKQEIYSDATDNANLLLLSPRLKQSLTGFLFSTATARIARPEQMHTAGGKGATVVGAVDMWQTDFGTIRIVPSRNIPQNDATSEVLLLNPEYWAMSYLTGFTTQDIPINGDSRRKMLLVDWTVCSKNEAASGVIADVNQSTAVSAA